MTRAPAGNHRTWAAPREDRVRRAPAVDTRVLGATLSAVARHHGLQRGAADDAVQLVAHALRARLAALVRAMLAAAAHRSDAQATAPPGMYEGDEPAAMWEHAVRRDVALQLAALERAEREEELRARKERRERLAALAAPPPAEDEDEDEPKRKSKKKEGPGVAARNMSEDVRKKMSNAVASHAVGLGKKYAWMTDAAAPAAAKPKATTPTPTPAPAPSLAPVTTTPVTAWSKPYVPGKAPPTPPVPEQRTLTLRDAMFVVERERGHGGGRGAARGWT